MPGQPILLWEGGMVLVMWMYYLIVDVLVLNLCNLKMMWFYLAKKESVADDELGLHHSSNPSLQV